VQGLWYVNYYDCGVGSLPRDAKLKLYEFCAGANMTNMVGNGAGGDAVWATMTNPYAGGYIQTTILYMFGVGGFATTISFIGYMKTWGQDKIPQEEIVEHIYRGYAKTFMHILESITIA